VRLHIRVANWLGAIEKFRAYYPQLAMFDFCLSKDGLEEAGCRHVRIRPLSDGFAICLYSDGDVVESTRCQESEVADLLPLFLNRI
jgi:hypothetical protein